MIVNMQAMTLLIEEVERLRTSGWVFTDDANRILATTDGVASPRDARNELGGLGDAVLDVRAEGAHGDLRVGLRWLGGMFEVDSLPDGSLDRHFEEASDRDLARRLEDRDTEAAFNLPFMWRISADLDLARHLPEYAALEVRVVLSLTWLVGDVVGAGVSDITRLLPSRGGRRVYIAIDTPAPAAHFGAVSFSGVADELELPESTAALPGEAQTGYGDESTPRPSLLEPLQQFDGSGPWAPIERVFGAAFLASTWIRLATSTRDDGRVVEFLGFKRVETAIPATDVMTTALIDGTRRLYRWAFQELSPDRLLAVRQVVSLYDGGEALLRPDDVVDSAEVVFLGLRSAAIREVMQGVRDAQTHAIDSVRQSLKAVQDLAKSATERVLAAVVAVGAVSAANSTQTLSDEVGRKLLLLVAGFLGLLAFFALVIEGPLLSLPLRKLEDDLREANPMLTESQRERAARLPSVAATRWRVRVLRVVVPLLYSALATAIIIWGYPDRYT